MPRLENEYLTAHIAEHGAELKSLMHRPTGKELMWQGDPAHWPRTSPVLFPVVGRLKDNAFTHGGKRYPMPQHGFARDRKFEVLDSEKESAELQLQSDEQSLESYPWPFKLTIGYQLINQCLEVTYTVANTGNELMYFSIGAHPGFNCAMPKSMRSIKAQMKLDFPRNLMLYRLRGGLLMREPFEGLTSGLDGFVELTDEQIEGDAMVFLSPIGRWMDLSSSALPSHSVRLQARDWPYFGIWSKVGAPFVCLEPWYGHADFEDATGEISQKAGIQTLKPGREWSATWSVEVRANK